MQWAHDVGQLMLDSRSATSTWLPAAVSAIELSRPCNYVRPITIDFCCCIMLSALCNMVCSTLVLQYAMVGGTIYHHAIWPGCHCSVGRYCLSSHWTIGISRLLHSALLLKSVDPRTVANLWIIPGDRSPRWTLPYSSSSICPAILSLPPTPSWW